MTVLFSVSIIVVMLFYFPVFTLCFLILAITGMVLEVRGHQHLGAKK